MTFYQAGYGVSVVNPQQVHHYAKSLVRHALIQWPVVVAGVQEQLEQVLAQLDAQIVALDTAIAQVLEKGEWTESALLLQRITGVGTLTTACLLVTTLNFTLGSTPNALSAYAGLAPLPHDSRSSIHSRRRIGHAGNRLDIGYRIFFISVVYTTFGRLAVRIPWAIIR